MTIINEQLGFAFYHIPRTAGSAITWGLAQTIPELPDPPSAEKTYEIHAWQHKYHLKRPNKWASVMHPSFKYEKWKHLKIYTVYRNPFDRAVSLYNWSKRKRGKFEDFVDHLMKSKRHGIASSQIIFCNPKFVTFDMRFENLNKDFKRMCIELGLKPINLPMINKSPTTKDYTEEYDSDTVIRKVMDLYSDDFEELNYPLDPYWSG